MKTKELLFEISQLRIKYKGKVFAIDDPIPYIEESCKLIEQFKKDVLTDFAKWITKQDEEDICFKNPNDIIDEYLDQLKK